MLNADDRKRPVADFRLTCITARKQAFNFRLSRRCQLEKTACEWASSRALELAAAHFSLAFPSVDFDPFEYSAMKQSFDARIQVRQTETSRLLQAKELIVLG